MGLLYLFPTGKEDSEHFKTDDESITLKTYGLPYIFWFYALASLAALLLLSLAVWPSLEKVINQGQTIDKLIGLLLLSLIILLPIVTLAFFFYEKVMTKRRDELLITHKVFFLPVFKRRYPLKSNEFLVEHFLDSPNMARLQNQRGSQGFQNRGYFELYAQTHRGPVKIDRHSRKADLIKIKSILENQK